MKVSSPLELQDALKLMSTHDVVLMLSMVTIELCDREDFIRD